MNNLLNKLNKSVNSFTSNTYIVFLVGLFVAIYGVFAAPETPEAVKSLFQNNVFKLCVILFVTYLSGARNTKLLFFVAFLFLLITHTLSQNGLFEKYDNYKTLERFQNLTEVSEESSEEMDYDMDMPNTSENSEEMDMPNTSENSEENTPLVKIPKMNKNNRKHVVKMPKTNQYSEEMSEEHSEEHSEEVGEEVHYTPKKIKRKLKNILGDVKDLTSDVNRLMKKL